MKFLSRKHGMVYTSEISSFDLVNHVQEVDYHCVPYYTPLVRILFKDSILKLIPCEFLRYC